MGAANRADRPSRPGLVWVLALAVGLSACGLRDPSVEEPSIETMSGYAVAVTSSSDSVMFAFSTDETATSGEAFDATTAIWRDGEDGLWTQPLIRCLSRGRPIDMGVVDVQATGSPGLLTQRVVWITCQPVTADE